MSHPSNTRSSRTLIPPPDHLPYCTGHIYCPECRRQTCARDLVRRRNGSPCVVVCLQCRTVFPALPVLH